MAAPPSETLHHVMHAAFDAFIHNLKPMDQQGPGGLFLAFKAGWDAREAVMRASVLDPDAGDTHVHT